MVKPLNNPDELDDRLSFLGPNADQWDLQKRLREAANETDTLVGTEIEELLRPSVKDQRKFKLAFGNIEKLIRVEVVSPRGTFDQKVDSDDYTFTPKPARGETHIEFDQTWAEDNLFSMDYRLRVVYIPEMMKDIELQLAKVDIARDFATQTGDEEAKAQADQAQERLGNMRDNFNRKTLNLGDPHTGRNLAANYNFPGDNH